MKYPVNTMKHTRITLFISSFAIAIFGGLFMSAPSAQATEITASLINTAIAKEESAETLTAEQRKAILKEVISASQNEIKTLTDTLNDLKLDDAWSLARDHFVATLATSSKYYAGLEARLAKEDISLDEIKAIATDLKAWRETTYTPALKETGNLILIIQTETVHGVVQLRAIKIGNDIKKLDKQKLVNTDALKKYLTQAEHSLKNAKILTDKAKGIYFTTSVAPLQPKKEVSAEELKPIAPQEQSPAEELAEIDSQDQVRDLAKESLKEIKAAYELFFKMNDRIRK
ncbi:hypothetical protein A2524_02345 [Candidatus Wolfebacteria bacterium RIFOXYD12_FULL_48_21]|uniref:DUF5667 domain-containing protein n=1 Tax=Candidatus Wolfebacteria bacterium RIFOXYD1_FULL_48_65 TaxID=1802561 RepID=A0A1F8E291_9BACT|nr:MAG: hypothetical protein A2524_02345 [Candidatus Wolfebacteria bacterium RIFOXYD12_FULL_48_21]OGM94810.1 MAG: hypothetical protein A2610_04060 [Candidatus Wolfebacteria bacterium RIFOXYD1_FULL_48_65]OGM97194.1 MAG: hypothetical protein A2532_02720 [Candidatus Wolfebacteria bacterium RIFOXYD2_FULL_48_11]